VKDFQTDNGFSSIGVNVEPSTCFFISSIGALLHRGKNFIYNWLQFH
jgi:hypothetical protein